MLHEHHGHAHAQRGQDRAFAIGIALNLAFVAIESVFGVLSHSMALLADAGHNLSDVLALALAWGASLLGRRRPSRASPTACAARPSWRRCSMPCC